MSPSSFVQLTLDQEIDSPKRLVRCQSVNNKLSVKINLDKDALEF